MVCRFPSRRGFTLLELLVVCGVIAVLIAILMPALNKARQAAVRVQCLSQMRQCYMDLRLYAANFGDRIPIGYGWSDKAQTAATWETTSTSYFGAYGGVSQMGYLWKAGYMKQPKIWYCPNVTQPGKGRFNTTYSDAGGNWSLVNTWPPGVYSNNSTYLGYMARPTTYWSSYDNQFASNSTFNWFGNYIPRNVPRFTQLKSMALLAEGSKYISSVRNRHGAGQNVMYADGSGVFVLEAAYRTNMLNAATPPNHNSNYFILNDPKGSMGTPHNYLAEPLGGVWVDFDRNR